MNLSSILGSLALHADARSPIYHSQAFAYDASRTALNAFAVHLAAELQDTPLEVSEGSRTSVQLALLPEDAPSGGYRHPGEPLPWQVDSWHELPGSGDLATGRTRRSTRLRRRD